MQTFIVQVPLISYLANWSCCYLAGYAFKPALVYASVNSFTEYIFPFFSHPPHPTPEIDRKRLTQHIKTYDYQWGKAQIYPHGERYLDY